MLWAICICCFFYYLIFRQSDVIVIQEKMLSFEIWHPTNGISTPIQSIKKNTDSANVYLILAKILTKYEIIAGDTNPVFIVHHMEWTHNIPRFDYSQLFWVQNIQKTILSKTDWSSLLSWKQNTNSNASYNLNLQWPNCLIVLTQILEIF